MHTTCKTIQFNGLNFNVCDSIVENAANSSSTPTLIFLHYWGGSSRTWKFVISKLASNFRCIAIDLRGWGDSDKSATNYSLEIQASDVLGIIREVGVSNYVIVGHSMGGKIAQLIASHRPSGLAGLVLVAPAPPTPMAVPEEQKQMMLESYQSREGVEAALSILTEKPLSSELREQAISDTLKGAADAKRAWTETNMAFDMSDIVSGINVPVTIVVGDADKIERSEVLQHELGSRFTVDTFKVLPGVGHLSPFEAPNELASVISEALACLP